MVALPKTHGMTVEEFQAWRPPHAARWHLIDGEPVAMAPASENHGALQAELGYLLTAQLRGVNSPCRVISAPGVVPRVRGQTNERIPDLGVTCTPPVGSQTITEPVVLVEILSPSNEAITRANVWAYTTLPSVQEIVLLHSVRVQAEVWRRDEAGAWGDDPEVVGPEDLLELRALEFAVPLHSVYRTTSLAQ